MATHLCPRCGGAHDADPSACPRDDGPPHLAGDVDRDLNGGDLTGHVIAERFLVLRKLVETGTGPLYIAAHVDTGFRSTLKILRPSVLSHGGRNGGCERELLNAIRIHHPNVAAVYDVGETDDGLVYAVTELIDGEPLSQVLDAGGALPISRALTIAFQAADAVQAAHEAGVVHGGLSPRAIILTRSEDGGDQVKVVDFGTSAPSCVGEIGQRGGPTLEMPYAAPERLAGEPPDARSDVFSLGAILHHLLTGTASLGDSRRSEDGTHRFAEPAPRPHQINAEVPEALDEVVMKAMAAAPTERFQTVSAFYDALASASPIPPAGAPRAAWPVSDTAGRTVRLRRVRDRRRTRKLRRIAISAAALALIVLPLALRLLSDRPATAPRPPAAAAGSPTSSTAVPPTASTSRPVPPASPGAAADAGTPSPTRRAPAARLNTDSLPGSAVAKRTERRARRTPTVEREAEGALATASAPGAGRVEADTAQPANPADANTTEAATEQVLSPGRATEPVAERPAVPTARPIPAPGTTPTTLAETRAAVQSAMAAYAGAIETRDIAAVRAAHPGLTSEQQKAWEEFFSSVRDLKARLTVEQVSLAGSVAQARVSGVYEYENETRGVPERVPVSFRAVFTRDPTGWRLTSIH